MADSNVTVNPYYQHTLQGAVDLAFFTRNDNCGIGGALRGVLSDPATTADSFFKQEPFSNSDFEQRYDVSSVHLILKFMQDLRAEEVLEPDRIVEALSLQEASWQNYVALLSKINRSKQPLPASLFQEPLRIVAAYQNSDPYRRISHFPLPEGCVRSIDDPRLWNPKIDTRAALSNVGYTSLNISQGYRLSRKYATTSGSASGKAIGYQTTIIVTSERFVIGTEVYEQDNNRIPIDDLPLWRQETITLYKNDGKIVHTKIPNPFAS